MISLDKQNRYRRIYASLKPGYQHSGQVYEGLLTSRLTAESRVLDAGCGRAGVLRHHLDEVGLGVGLDSDEASLRDNEGLDDKVVGDLASLPFPADVFDLILCTWVVEHLQAPHAAFAEFSQVLKRGGYLLILTPNAWSYVTLVTRSLAFLFRILELAQRPSDDARSRSLAGKREPGGWMPREGASERGRQNSRLRVPRLQRFLVNKVYSRHELDTFPLAYRANTKRQLDSQLRQVGLQNEEFHYLGDPSYIAFNDLLFKVGILLERITDLGLLQSLKVHLVASYVKS